MSEETKSPLQEKSPQEIMDKLAKKRGKPDPALKEKIETARAKTQKRAPRRKKKEDLSNLTEDVGTSVVTIMDAMLIQIGVSPITPIEELEDKLGNSPALHKEYAQSITDLLNKKFGEQISEKAVEYKFYIMTASIFVLKLFELKTAGKLDGTKGLFKKIKLWFKSKKNKKSKESEEYNDLESVQNSGESKE